MRLHGRERGLIAVLGAFCIFLSTIEYMLPRPAPFIRLGLSNLPVLIALAMPLRPFFTLVLVKIISQALISGTLVSHVFFLSFFGSAASACVMFALYRIFYPRFISITGISVAGAFCSNAAQIEAARLLIMGEAAYYIAPPVLALGIASGLALGLFARAFMQKSSWYKAVFNGGALFDSGSAPAAGHFKESSDGNFRFTKDTARFLLALALSVPLLFIQEEKLRIAVFFPVWIFAAVNKKAGNPLAVIIVFLSVTACALITPHGRVLARLGPLIITGGALLSGLSKAALIEALIMLSKTLITRNLVLPGRLGGIISESFGIAFSIAGGAKSISIKRFIPGIDALLEKVYPP